MLQPAFNEKGETLSPILPEEVKNFLIDIDGTICDDIPNEEPERMVDVPFYPDALEIINTWYDEGLRSVDLNITDCWSANQEVVIITGLITTL